MKKLTKKEFIERSKIIHNNKYDYSKAEYVNLITRVCIICPEHGEFWQTPKNHLKGWGCQKCSYKKRGIQNSGTKEEFILKAREKHGDKYDYSKAEYKGSGTPLCIICPEHGEFWQSPTRHLNSLGCKKCLHKNEDKKSSLEVFIAKSRALYGEKFDFSKARYVNSQTKLTIVCPEHGEFEITPHSHLHSSGCPQCVKENKRKKREIKEENYREKKRKGEELKLQTILKNKNNFIQKSIKIHGGKYDYSKVEYVNSMTKVCIICPEHGEFWQAPNNHVAKAGCPKCARQKTRERYTSSKEEFVEKARRIHGDKYDYSKVEYVNSFSKVCIICPEHGEFWQTPAMHCCEKQGCPNCGTLSSRGEIEVIEFIKEILPNTEIIQREHNLIKPKEIDIYIPSKKIAIEYDGLRWHSELFEKDRFYRLMKTEKCEEKGVRTIHIFEDEWVYRKEIVKDKLKHILCKDSKKIYARKCTIKEISHKVSEDFLQQNHIQGGAIATVHIGLYFAGKLVSVMTLIKRQNEWELNRFSTLLGYSIIGAGGKLLSYFIKKYDPAYIKSFADLRWTSKDNNIYERIGFKKEEVLPPNYTYVTDKNSFRLRYHKFNFRKQALHKKYGFPLSMTEKEMTRKLGYYKIYDCGLIKYVWKKEK